ncbi:MAG: GNAT family N-acetyltransferase [Candidatus Aureabacteria bacterium]|nr:GNAT family N-acetyltransferase [Candidatus Auribacterota bacterium]
MKPNAEAEFVVRSYRPSDRERVRQIAVATAFLGAFPGRSLPDRELTADLLTGYYTDLEPSSALVAVIGGEVIGYLLGALSTTVYEQGMRRLFLRRILPGLLRGRYRLGGAGARLAAVALGGLLQDARHPDLNKLYPAHLHINVDRPRRSGGAGSLLMGAWMRRLAEEAVPGVHLSTNSAQPAAIRFFARHGFRTVFRSRSTLSSYLTGTTVFREILAIQIAG